MSAVSVLTLKEPIIPLVSSFHPEDLRTVKLEHKWTTTGANAREEYAKMYLPVADDPSQKEVFLYVVDQFLDAAHSDRLHLTQGQYRYNKFRQVLGGAALITWQTLSDARAAKTVDTFMEDLRTLIDEYMSPTSYSDQLEYLRSATKPFNMDCAGLGARLRVISKLGRRLPGSIDATGTIHRELYTTEDEFKRAYFTLMPSSWKIKFAESGHVLEGNTYTYQQLVRFMAVQEAISKRSLGKRKERERTHGYSSGRGAGGYGRGRGGGRGYGRGGGRGFGRGNYGGGSSYGSYGRGYSSGRGQAGNVASSYPGSFPPATPGGQWGWNSRPSAPSTPAAGYNYPSRGGFQGRSNYGRYGGRSSYGRGRGPSRGRGPPLPAFMADQEQYYQQEEQYDDYSGQEHFYQEQGTYGEEHFHQEEPSAGAEEVQGEEHFYGDEPQEPQEDTTTETHWLQDFGF